MSQNERMWKKAVEKNTVGKKILRMREGNEQ